MKLFFEIIYVTQVILNRATILYNRGVMYNYPSTLIADCDYIETEKRGTHGGVIYANAARRKVGLGWQIYNAKPLQVGSEARLVCINCVQYL